MFDFSCGSMLLLRLLAALDATLLFFSKSLFNFVAIFEYTTLIETTIVMIIIAKDAPEIKKMISRLNISSFSFDIDLISA